MDLHVYRVVGDDLLNVGRIARRRAGSSTFTYDEAYLEGPSALELSCSLPLRAEPYVEAAFRPYFDGLLPEGVTREALAERLRAPADDYLTLLSLNGLDCIGDVVILDDGDGNGPSDWNRGIYEPRYEPITLEEMARTTDDLAALADSNMKSRLSLAGNQGKVGLAHVPDQPIEAGWLRPLGGAASTHILKVGATDRIAEFEIVCMGGLEACGIAGAGTGVLSLDKPVVVSRRFDRVVEYDGATLDVARLHQEDLAQAFGRDSHLKYRELEGGTYHAIAELLRRRSVAAAEDIGQLARIAIYNYLVGNCDNHLKNLSVLHMEGGLLLAPVYDVVCTTFFERFPRELGMQLGQATVIDDVAPDDFLLLARDVGLGPRRMRVLCREIAEAIVEGVGEAGDRFGDVDEMLPYEAENVLIDMEPRLRVVAAAGA